MNLEILVDSDNFWTRFAEDIDSAQKNIYIQTLSFEGDKAGLQLAERLTAAAAPDKRIIIDNYTKYMLSDKFRYSPRNLFDEELKEEGRETSRMVARLIADGTKVRFVNPVGPFLCRFPIRNHKKILVIDGRIGYIGGINFSDHNFDWHDMMLRIEDDDAVEYLTEDFMTSWQGGHFAGNQKFGDLELFSLDGRSNENAFEEVFRLIGSARRSIYVQSPYLSFPFCDHLRMAAERNVKVTVTSPEKNNFPGMDDYIRWESARGNYDLLLYPDRMTHLKAMLIDDSHLIVGSSNFDHFSYKLIQEIFAVVTDRTTIDSFIKQIIDIDNPLCHRPQDDPNRLRGYLRNLQLKSINRVSALFK
ncbi:MAG: phosphatidylserine/phosphatidylglycerophosphate/cardiolipin synthase family protein [FCB group bacterium]|nr:phosphatidylserine/phosphatidylglycerophosphate/cardiolipin synthase family protein [FCB group bacterium]